MDIVFAFSDVGSADLFPFERNLLTFLVFFYLGIGFIQQTTNMHTVGAVHERPGSTRSVFRIRLGAFAGRGLCRRAIRESPLQSYREACCVKPIPIKINMVIGFNRQTLETVVA